MNNQIRQPQKNELDHQGMLNYTDFELNKEIVKLGLVPRGWLTYTCN